MSKGKGEGFKGSHALGKVAKAGAIRMSRLGQVRGGARRWEVHY
jgi:hypothetical protein